MKTTTGMSSDALSDFVMMDALFVETCTPGFGVAGGRFPHVTDICVEFG
jgi:hypothetical protein